MYFPAKSNAFNLSNRLTLQNACATRLLRSLLLMSSRGVSDCTLPRAPGHSCWSWTSLSAKFLEFLRLGGKPADLKLPCYIFRVFSSFQLSCTPFLYSWTFYPQLYLFSLAHYFPAFLFVFPCSGPCFCQFHARPVLGVSPRALETIRRLFPFVKNRPDFFIINHLLFFTILPGTIKKLDENYF